MAMLVYMLEHIYSFLLCTGCWHMCKNNYIGFFVQVHEFVLQKHINMTTINSTMLSDGLSDEPSSPESTTFDDSDLLRSAVSDDVTAQLAAAGRQLYAEF